MTVLAGVHLEGATEEVFEVATEAAMGEVTEAMAMGIVEAALEPLVIMRTVGDMVGAVEAGTAVVLEAQVVLMEAKAAGDPVEAAALVEVPDVGVEEET
ncbi:hypothetical protein HPB50_010537 [Hyalomma asiaticum]|uniref:Uncharacterized protein n=1 Tax=Hyalomma asiaticum TaxID=266040 RepID=A0ACB7S865_HYAAI|nr:hypothetical protein HPB50_010537 [Hyalomma asiaticum]